MRIFLILFATLFPSFSFSQLKDNYTVHEWGTFTTLHHISGSRMEGLEAEEEPLPHFVHQISLKGIYLDQKGDQIFSSTYFSGVNVKMETPVIYFYSEVEKKVKVKVEFQQGTISQWYPDRTSGESKDFARHMDFFEPRVGLINWDVKILSEAFSGSPTHFTDIKVWNSPRETKSNMIDVNGQLEKYLFYRGMARFDIPIKIEFNSHNKLMVTNNSKDQISYAMVYEKGYNGMPPKIWWRGALQPDSENFFCIPEVSFGSMNSIDSSGFREALMDAGLYEDEAKAMLATWHQSYFEKPGLRVFWIVPKQFTDSILPITLDPEPIKLERVMVGRSEIIRPKNDMETSWLTKADQPCMNEIEVPVNYTIESFEVFPNPLRDRIFIHGYFQGQKNLNIQIYNSMGACVHQISEVVASGIYRKELSTGELENGVYFLTMYSSAGVEYISKKLVKLE